MSKELVFVGDFETTVYDNQTFTEVWASALVELDSEDVLIHHKIGDTFRYLTKRRRDIRIYYHNLKFDGAFWLDYLLRVLGMKQAFIDEDSTEFLETKYMLNDTFKYMISDRGQFYSITIKINNHIIDIRDSYKLLPFSVKHIGNTFGTKHKKLDMEYKGFRYAGCDITDKEKEYIANDVLIVKEALEIMFRDGHDSLTIGSCCLKEFRRGYHNLVYKELFPTQTDLLIDRNLYGAENADEYVRKSYKGGWCYLKPDKAQRILTNGFTLDVNSLYPSMMHSFSGNYYPTGNPTFFTGMVKESVRDDKFYYWFIRIRCRFKLKKNKLPFIQIKNSFLYLGNVSLTTSDIDGQPHYLTLTLTKTDYELFHEHYNVIDETPMDGCYYNAEKGLFDNYINKYMEIKMNSKGATREEAKLFLNNLYGKMASGTDSSYKIAYIKEDGSTGFKSIPEKNKRAGYIPVGTAITSYSRAFTIRAAQKNYAGFAYADTDSIHCDMPLSQVKGVEISNTALCCWKLEGEWDKAFFTRQKTYIEIIDGKYDVKCAGLPDRCKELFIQNITNTSPVATGEEIDKFFKRKLKLEDFKPGISIPLNLKSKRIKGGIILKDDMYVMH